MKNKRSRLNSGNFLFHLRFLFFSCQRFTHWLPIWARVQSVSPDMILTDCFFLHINSSLTQPPPYHQYNHHHHHSSVTVMHCDFENIFWHFYDLESLSSQSKKIGRPKMEFWSNWLILNPIFWFPLHYVPTPPYVSVASNFIFTPSLSSNDPFEDWKKAWCTLSIHCSALSH